ncbi:MAG TPA: hypothetical protein VMD30_14165 [Tepidisphaeraceae bacterium]|nr:hypothetical protein [Tepidisphaeraceae bacterium]
MDGPSILPAPRRQEGKQAAAARGGFYLLVAFLLVVAVGKAVLFDSIDPDAFWHLKVADVLAQQRFPHPIVDHLSFASVRRPWTPYSWLAELGMKFLWDRWQVRGAVAAHAILSGAIVLFAILAALEGSTDADGRRRYLVCCLVGAAAEFLALPFVSFRPVTLAMALLSIIAWLVQRDRRMREKSRAVWWIVLLTAFTANVHMFVVFAPMLVAAYFLGAWIEKNSASIRRYGLMLGLTAAASLMSPMLPGMVTTSLHFATDDVMVHSHIIAELQPFYKGSTGPVAVGFLVALVGCGLWRRKSVRPGEWILLAFCLVVLVKLGRFAPMLAIFMGPMLAACAPRMSDKALANRALGVAMAVLLLAASVKIVRGFPGPAETTSQWLERLGPDCPGYPTKACDFVDRAIVPRTHRLIDEFTWGGYLEWRLGDRYQVLIDGRTQLYSSNVWNALYLGTPTQRLQYLRGLSADAAVLPAKDSAFAGDLMQLGWTVVYRDVRAQVLAPPKTVPGSGFRVPS